MHSINTPPSIDGVNGALISYTRPSDDQWYEMLAIGLRPSPRSGHTFTGFPDGVVLLFGGTTSGNVLTNSLYEYRYVRGCVCEPIAIERSC
jgi:Galactose oxidase, central domain